MSLRNGFGSTCICSGVTSVHVSGEGDLVRFVLPHKLQSQDYKSYKRLVLQHQGQRNRPIHGTAQLQSLTSKMTTAVTLSSAYKGTTKRLNIKKKHVGLSDLENERRCGLELQNPGGTERLEHGVGIVAESLVDHHQGVHVVHVEPDLIRARAALGKSQLRVGHRWSQAHHDGVVVHCAVLKARQREGVFLLNLVWMSGQKLLVLN